MDVLIREDLDTLLLDGVYVEVERDRETNMYALLAAGDFGRPVLCPLDISVRHEDSGF